MKPLIFLLAFFISGCSVVSHHTNVVSDDASGSLSFDVRPKEAKIYLDDEFVGLAKYFDGKKRQIKVLPGEHTVTLKYKGYQDIVKRVYMSDTHEHFHYDMAASKKTGERKRTVIRT